ncbi:hypothetical protein FOZ63_008401 [Perkinsus olseni]|uniref:Uncharacterized protein n=1 Tax=Perkinsus olseni TaxID=32597 RepID=A0A7J6QYL5_PEROL|nr:hypothetical protein FOZ62_000592 [Perkinsus olseni]KAF4741640.1 hypothetical protein FOZ63_008401 [Perkinsus olseni]
MLPSSPVISPSADLFYASLPLVVPYLGVSGSLKSLGLVSKLARSIVLEPTSWSHADLESPLSTGEWSMDRYKTVVTMFACVSELMVHGRVEPLPKLLLTLSAIQRLRRLELIGVTASPIYDILSPSSSSSDPLPYLESLDIGLRQDEVISYPGSGTVTRPVLHSRLREVRLTGLDFGPNTIDYDTFSNDNGIASWLIHFLASCPVLETLDVLQRARRREECLDDGPDAARQIVFKRGMPTWNSSGHLRRLHLGLWSDRVAQGLVHRLSAGSLEILEGFSVGVLSEVTLNMALDRGLGPQLRHMVCRRWLPSPPGPDGEINLSRVLSASRHSLRGISLQCVGGCVVPWDLIMECITRFRPPKLEKVYLTMVMDDRDGTMVAPKHTAQWCAALRCHYPNIPYFRRTTYTVIMDDLKKGVGVASLGFQHTVNSPRELFEEEQALCVKPFDNVDRRSTLDEDEQFLGLWDQLPVEYQGQYWNIYNALFGVLGPTPYQGSGVGALTPTPPRRALNRRLRSPTPQPRAVPLDTYGRVESGRSSVTALSRGTDEYNYNEDDDTSSIGSDGGSIDILTVEELLKEDLTVLDTDDSHQPSFSASAAAAVAYSGG